MQPALAMAMAIVALLANALPPAAIAAAACTPAFAGKWPAAILFACLMVEKNLAMFVGMRRGRGPRARPGWSMALVGWAYTLTMYAAFWEFLRSRVPPAPVPAVVGLAAYAGALALHHLSARALRRAGAAGGLVTGGPYRFITHPIYVGACIEALALPVALGAWFALAFAALVFVPLEIHRALSEERSLAEQFGAAFRDYAARTPRFLPWPRRRRSVAGTE
jgi:protein-S-isoprenylcysteine O-methyltransferase Ste14